MCQPQPGLRCANHLTKEISKLENKENLSPEETSELRKLKVSYFGTRTGQQELDQKISIAEAAGSTSKAYSLNQLKEKAKTFASKKKLQQKHKQQNKLLKPNSISASRILKLFKRLWHPCVTFMEESFITRTAIR